MMKRTVETAMQSPTARAIGVVYLFYFLTAFVAEFLVKGVVVPGDAASTANNILAHESLYRAGFAVGLIANVIYIAVTALFYRLFGPVNWSMSLIAAFCSLTGCAIQIFGGLLQVAPFILLRTMPLAQLYSTAQLQGMALLSLMLYRQVFSISLVLFAFYDLLLGYLIFRSTFLPRILGLFLIFAGIGWLSFLWPPLATALSAYILSLGALAEILLMLWLIVKGVNVSRWRELAIRNA